MHCDDLVADIHAVAKVIIGNRKTFKMMGLAKVNSGVS